MDVKLPLRGEPSQALPGLIEELSVIGDEQFKTSEFSSRLKFHGGERVGIDRMHLWMGSRGLNSYKTTFRRLLGDYSSRLSPHLAFGCVSPRRLCTEALTVAPNGPHVEHFIYELCWRDFLRHSARKWGSDLFKVEGPLGPRLAGDYNRSWKRDEEAERRWKSGTLGVPLVDAAMREMLLTGYMGNIARQFTAAYLVEELGIDWRVGADWFESHLVDYDPHSNWGQWARSAGVAPTNDAKQKRVGGTRYLDIALGSSEAERYVRSWVTELASLPDSEILSPWRSSEIPVDYPRVPLCSQTLKQYFERGIGGRRDGKAGGKVANRFDTASKGCKGGRKGK